MTPDMASIQWLSQVDVPGRLFRAADPGEGVGDRSQRLEGRDRAAAERRRPADRIDYPVTSYEILVGFPADRRARTIAASI